MIQSIVSITLRNKIAFGVLLLIFCIVGIWQVFKLPIDAVPDITNNQVQIITVEPSLGATDIERLITIPIEQCVSNIPHVIEQRSFSRFGLSIVTLVFADDIDPYWARQQTSERLQQSSDLIPNNVSKPYIAPLTTGLGEIFQYAVKAKPGYESIYTPIELRTIQDWIIRKQLLQTPGVADVSSFGGLLKQYEVSIDPNRLYANKITIDDVFEAVSNNNQNTGGAYIEKGPNALFIRAEGLLESIENVQEIVIKNLSDGTPLLIKDIAQVNISHATRFGALTLNGNQQVSGAIVMMLKGENSNTVIKAIKSKIIEIEKMLPKGVCIEPFLDRTKMVNAAIETVTYNLIEGALIVIFILVIFLGNIRAGILVAFVIPLSMLFAITGMNLLGISGNLMSLGALDFGLIIDGAVIIVEAMLHRLTNYNSIIINNSKWDNEVKKVTSRFVKTSFFGQLIILMVYVPIFTLKGIEGKMFIPMAQTVVLALLGAFIFSLTFIPWASSIFLNQKTNSNNIWTNRLHNKIQKVYTFWIIKVFRSPIFFGSGLLLLIIGSVFFINNLGGEFIPSLPEGDFAVEVRVLPGSGLEKSVEISSKAAKLLLNNFPEIEKIVTKTGSSEIPIDPMPLDASDMIITLKKKKDWISANSYKELENKMQNCLNNVPGATFSFQYPVAMRFNELISGARQDVVCKIFGPNLDTLANISKTIGRICSNIDNVTGLYVEQNTDLPQITIKYNRNRVAQYGLNIKKLNVLVNTSLVGACAGQISDNFKKFDLIVRFSINDRSNLEDIGNILIKTQTGVLLPLKEIAEISINNGYSQIQHEGGQRRITVGFNVKNGNVEDCVNNLKSEIDQSVQLPAGYFISYGGSFENLQKAKSRLFIAVPVALCIILFLLYYAFKSIKLSMLIFSAVPLSAIGGIMALYFRSIPFSISAGIGFIALFGVSVLNGIVLISEYQLKSPNSTNLLLRHILYSSRLRIRPVLLTASVAALGFLPMAYSNGEGAEVQRPLATVVIGGLLLSTLLTLFLLPFMYWILKTHKKIRLKNALLPLFIFVSFNNNAQTYLSYNSFLDSVLKFSTEVKILQLNYQQKVDELRATKEIPGLNINSEYGQFNSIYKDYKIGVDKNISYIFKNKIKEELIHNNIIDLKNQKDINLLEYKKRVSILFSDWIYLFNKDRLLRKMDSLLNILTIQSEVMLKTGTIELLQLSIIEQQKMQLNTNLKENENLLLQTENKIKLHFKNVGSFIPYVNINEDTILQIKVNLIAEHPELKLMDSRINSLKQQYKLINFNNFPELSLGYNIMTMQGMGADNLIYNNKFNFNWLQLSLLIPLEFEKNHHLKKASLLRQQITLLEKMQLFNYLESDLRLTLKSFINAKTTFLQYLNKVKPQTESLFNQIQLKLNKGEIDFANWLILYQSIISIQIDYLNAIRNYYIQKSNLTYLINSQQN